MKKYIGFYDTCSGAFEDFLSNLDVLLNVRLTHQILFDLPTLDRYLIVISYDIERTSPIYQLVFQLIYNNHAEPLVSFANSAGKVLVEIPIFLKPVLKVPMSLYMIKMVPVLIDLNIYLNNKEYIQMQVQCPFTVMSPDSYIPLRVAT